MGEMQMKTRVEMQGVERRFDVCGGRPFVW